MKPISCSFFIFFFFFFFFVILLTMSICRKLTRKDDFIQCVLEFDGLSQSTNFPVNAIAIIKSQYLSQPNFTKKAVEYASKACGILSLFLFLSFNLSFSFFLLFLFFLLFFFCCCFFFCNLFCLLYFY
jgi:hypothetical protein